jgi:WD40 repeat protein
MADARIKGVKAASLAGHTYWVRSVAFSPDGQHISIREVRARSTRLVEGVVSVWREGGCVSQIHGLRYVRATYCQPEVLTTW